ncbi:unnamed protein product [Linum trigynum]|uniref:Uncharacterized protein n=1 Tax=Linum trigynum TaxID=586398 RepID=A0AAV2FXL7_9ROSI
MRASAMDPVSSADSPSGSSQTAFSTPPRHPYIRRIPTGSSSTSVALGSMNSEVPSPQLARVGPVSYARPRTEAVLRQTGPPPEPQ